VEGPQVKINVHLCGVASAFESWPSNNGRKKVDTETGEVYDDTGRPQGSLYSQQKKAIADACEYMRIRGKFKPRIFVVTSPGKTSAADEKPIIKKFTHNLVNGYGCENYVWVREHTKKGFPHFHFVADMDKFDPVKMSLYWSGLFGVEAKNSIRLGTRPNQYGKRKFWLEDNQMAWYMSKYIGKGLSADKKLELFGRSRVRMFGMSQELSKIRPLVYVQSDYSGRFQHKKTKAFVLQDSEFVESFYYERELTPERVFNPKKFSWKWTGHGNTYTGIPRTWLSTNKNFLVKKRNFPQNKEKSTGGLTLGL